MKKITLLLIGALFGSLFAFAQQKQITLNLKNVTVKEALEVIKTTGGYSYWFDAKDLDVKRKVSIKVVNKSIDEVLSIIFKGQEIEYKIKNGYIVISKSIEKEIPVQKKTEIRKVSGIVLDELGIPVIGANVMIPGTNIAAITDMDGKFSINGPTDAKLLITYIGFKSQTAYLSGSNNLKIALSEEPKLLEEVVAVGYGTMKKKSLTGAISTISSKDIINVTSTSLAQKLEGKVAGLNIRQLNGEPGNFSNSINIRGFGEPLYVIDGIVRGGGADFQRLNGEDIESISILKDGSAAIYGLNAANGVILVTTKKGTNGKTKFTFGATTGLSTPTDVPLMANAFQYLTMRNDANVNMGLAPFITQAELAKWQTAEPGYESTNWGDATFKKYAVRHEYNLTARGGNEKVGFFVSAGMTDEGSILRSNDINYNKFNFRSNITAQLTNNISANFNIAGFVDKKNEPSAGMFSVWRGTVSQLPTSSVYANDNPLYLHRVQDGQSMNPVAVAQSDLTGYNQPRNTNFQTSTDITYKVPFLKGLELKGVASYDSRFEMYKSVGKNYQLYDYQAEKVAYVATDFNTPARIVNTYNNSTYLTLQAQALYKTTIAQKHNVSATAIYEMRDQAGRNAAIIKYFDFYTNDQLDQASEKNAKSWGSEWQIRNLSYLGRITYDYMGKYLLEFAGRYDGSYRYSPDARWGFFPVASAGWRMSEEKFMKNIIWLSNLKLRGSVGVIGQDAGAPFQYLQGFSTSGGGHYGFANGETTLGAATPALVNANLTWMQSQIKDIGFDLGLFNNKLTFTADVYQRDRTGLLAYRNVTLPNTFGGTLPQENLNSDRVVGVEISTNYNDKVGEFSYNIGGNFNLGRTMNRYVESGPYTSSWQKYVSGTSNRWNDIVWAYNKVGQFQSTEDVLYSPIQDGNLANKRELPGDFKYEDTNGDGVIDGNDAQPLFHGESPVINFGLSMGANWKGFDLSLLFQGAAGFTVSYTHAYTTMLWGNGNLPAYFYDRWHLSDPYNPATSTWVPGVWPATRNEPDVGALYMPSGAWRRSASYLRLKNVELGYTFKQAIIHKIGLEFIRTYVNVSNVYTWCDAFVKPFDPESISGDYSAGWKYPLSCSINMGVTIDF